MAAASVSGGAGVRRDREQRENLFRELTRPKVTRNQLIGFGIAVLAGLVLVGSGGGSTILGLVVLGVCGWVVYQRWTGTLERVDVRAVEKELKRQTDLSHAEAIEQLHLDLNEDVRQEVTLFGGAPRDWIPGRTKSLTGRIRPHDQVRWLPARPIEPGGDGLPALFGRYQIHHLFATDDYVGFFTQHWDLIDAKFVDIEDRGGRRDDDDDSPGGYATGQIYYGDIENVRMTQSRLELQTIGGRSHVFGLRMPLQQNESPLKIAGGNGSDPKAFNRASDAQMRAGEAFANTVNQLRHEARRSGDGRRG